MQATNPLPEDRTVSPVTGVILMVAITAVLAAVIGTFVLGFGQNACSTTVTWRRYAGGVLPRDVLSHALPPSD